MAKNKGFTKVVTTESIIATETNYNNTTLQTIAIKCKVVNPIFKESVNSGIGFRMI